MGRYKRSIIPATLIALLVALLRLLGRDLRPRLTASIAVRKRPISVTPARAILAVMFKEARSHLSCPGRQARCPLMVRTKIDSTYHGLEEVTSSIGLSSGTDAFAPCVRRTQQE